MDATQIIFILSALLIVISALRVVTTPNLVHAALWLVSALFGVAILYVLLEAGFMAVIQVVVYIGAIAIMFIFAVMLTRKELLDKGPQLNPGWPMAAVLGLLTLGGLLAIVTKFPAREAAAISGDTLNALAEALIMPTAYVLPFEVASVLLLAALVGAVYVAMNKK